jgi:hypothetical protein
MIWLAWRQFRTQALVTLGLLAAFAALLLVTGLHLHDVYDSLGGKNCNARNDCYSLTGSEKPLQAVIGPALLAIPALLGMFWGAPLIARELESGTYRLAWTQTVSRRRWLSVKVALVGAVVLVVAGLASWLVSWWFAPLDAVNLNRLDPSTFTARGVVAIGYAAFAFALGVAAGMLARRTLPAMAASLFGFVAARIAFTLWVRPHLLNAREVLVSLTAGKGVGLFESPAGVSVAPGSPPIPNGWMLSAALVDRAHHAVSTARLHDLLVRACPAIVAGLPGGSPAFKTAGPGPTGGALLACQQRLGRQLQQLVSFQPPSHYWPLQALEAGIFLTAALALVGATIWAIGRRKARRPAVGEARQRFAEPIALEVAPETNMPTVHVTDDGEQSGAVHRHRASPDRPGRRI